MFVENILKGINKEYFEFLLYLNATFHFWSKCRWGCKDTFAHVKISEQRRKHRRKTTQAKQNHSASFNTCICTYFTLKGIMGFITQLEFYFDLVHAQVAIDLFSEICDFQSDNIRCMRAWCINRLSPLFLFQSFLIFIHTFFLSFSSPVDLCVGP